MLMGSQLDAVPNNLAVGMELMMSWLKLNPSKMKILCLGMCVTLTWDSNSQLLMPCPNPGIDLSVILDASLIQNVAVLTFLNLCQVSSAPI